MAETLRPERRLLGACARIDQIEQDAELAACVASQFSSVTPEIHLKWNSVENKEGQFWFGPVDRLIAFAQRNGQRVHGHALIWEQSTPDWALHQLRRDGDWGLVERHIHRVMGRYRDVIGDWDVVNEPIDTQNGRNGLRRNTFQQVFGSNYIERALETAHEAAPQARLLLNEYGFEYDNYVEVERRAAFLSLLQRLLDQGVPLHAVGIQAHLDLGKGPIPARDVADFLQAIADMGLAILITELDVKERDYRATIAERDMRVSDEVRRYLDIALTQPAVESVTTWGVTDRHSWLQVERGDQVDPERFGSAAPNRGLPFDSDLRPKPMHVALQDAIGQNQQALRR
ncbi:endo-1,4-beta-xylanase [Devosia aurantiaca]|uniref:Beta-xylanase n=1 Tax=Devosia aurantiaca TaxID=2714858 RepID=A0A6M1SEV2_9HYPH|nr:endo-1,4-beta-xylanase [Devosia aurantiaca]NGP18389.1 endo-1,4-beta-xylanase [Devosia aurantiaca]